MAKVDIFFQSTKHMGKKHPLCHPERSRGISSPPPIQGVGGLSPTPTLLTSRSNQANPSRIPVSPSPHPLPSNAGVDPTECQSVHRALSKKLVKCRILNQSTFDGTGNCTWATTWGLSCWHTGRRANKATLDVLGLCFKKLT